MFCFNENDTQTYIIIMYMYIYMYDNLILAAFCRQPLLDMYNFMLELHNFNICN